MVKKKSVRQTKYEEMDQYDFGDIDSMMERNYERYAPYIGGFLINFSGLEHDLDRAIAELIFDRTHEKVYIIIKNLSMNNKIELFKDLLLHMIQFAGGKKNQLSEKLKNFVTRIKSINTFRNQIAHAKWNTLTKDGFVRVKIESKDGATRYKSEHITPRLMKAGITEMGKLAELTHELPQSAWYALGQGMNRKQTKKANSNKNKS